MNTNLVKTFVTCFRKLSDIHLMYHCRIVCCVLCHTCGHVLIVACAILQNKKTPLQAAAIQGHVSCCRILLKYGVDVNAVDEVSLVNATTAL